VAKIYYCGGLSGRLGVLRAVMPFSDLGPLVSSESFDYVGQSFPELNRDTATRTVIEIVREEEDGSWKAGFYLLEKGPLHFEDSLRTFCQTAGRPI